MYSSLRGRTRRNSLSRYLNTLVKICCSVRRSRSSSVLSSLWALLWMMPFMSRYRLSHSARDVAVTFWLISG